MKLYNEQVARWKMCGHKNVWEDFSKTNGIINAFECLDLESNVSLLTKRLKTKDVILPGIGRVCRLRVHTCEWTRQRESAEKTLHIAGSFVNEPVGKRRAHRSYSTVQFTGWSRYPSSTCSNEKKISPTLPKLERCTFKK